MEAFEEWWSELKDDETFDIAGDKECCEESWRAALKWAEKQRHTEVRLGWYIDVRKIEKELEEK